MAEARNCINRSINICIGINIIVCIRSIGIANPSGYPADLLATVRGRCLVFRPWMSGCLDVWMSGCLDVWMSGCLDIWMSGCLEVKNDVLSTIPTSRCQKVMYCRRF